MIHPTDSSHIDVRLIEKALALTGKKMSHIWGIVDRGTIMQPNGEFKTETYDYSIEKFGWYLLSPEFIEKYHKRYTDYPYWNNSTDHTYANFGIAIGKCQSGNEQPLISLLEKI